MRIGSTQRYGCSLPSNATGEWRRAIPLVLLVSIMLALAGACATMTGNPSETSQTSAQKAQEVIPMLQTAGFDLAPATTPSEIAQLQSLPPLKLGYYIDKDGAAQYWMADPDDCKCIMHGDEAAYQRYENLKLENEVAERDRRAIAAQQQQQQSMGMGMGGPGMGFGFGNGGFGGGGFGFGGGGMGIAF
jgi:uncharacterized membrane protein YgcG